MGMVAFLAAISADTAEQFIANPDTVEEYLFPEDGEGRLENCIGIDKAWHGIHYLLNGTVDGGTPPLSWAVLGATEVGEDMGYGPACMLTAEQVQAVAAALPSEEQFTAAFDPAALEAAEIYPSMSWVKEGEEALEYLVWHYRALIEFYRAAVARGDAAIVWLC